MKRTLFVASILFYSLASAMDGKNETTLPMVKINNEQEVVPFLYKLVAYTTTNKEDINPDAYILNDNLNVYYAAIGAFSLEIHTLNILIQPNSNPRWISRISCAQELSVRVITQKEKAQIQKLINEQKAKFEYPNIRIAKALDVEYNVLYKCSGFEFEGTK